MKLPSTQSSANGQRRTHGVPEPIGKAAVRLALFVIALLTPLVGYPIYDGVRSAAVDKACRSIAIGDSEHLVLKVAGHPSEIRPCGAQRDGPTGPSSRTVTQCTKEYWYSTEYFGGGWLVKFDDAGRVVATIQLRSP